MTAEATFLREWDDVRETVAVAAASGEVYQLADGRAGILAGLTAAAAAEGRTFKTIGQFTVAKTSGIVFLDGGRVYWDHSANAAYFRKVNDQDFYLGRAVGDSASGDTSMVVNINIDPPYDIDALRDACLSVPTGTQAVGGFGFPKMLGAARLLELTATNEAQCIDLLSVDKFAVAANAIVEAIIRPVVNGTTNAVDFNVGVGNGTSTTDADAVTEHVFFHIDGASTAINAQSKDGTTTVAATDTTKVISAGSAVANRTEVWIDTRNPASVKLYVDGVAVLTSTTFDLSHATGPLGIIAHIEKTSSTATAQIVMDALRARFAEQ